MNIREANEDDWPAIWAVMQPIVADGETYAWPRDLSSDAARARWLHDEPPGRTFVAVDPDGSVLGTAESEPNREAAGAHIANASFMVAPAAQGRGVGRALCNHVLATARTDGYRAMQFNAVVETNTGAVHLWTSLGFEILATVPEAFLHPTAGYVGLHIMYRRL